MIKSKGLETTARFRVQAGIAASYALDMLKDGSDVKAVVTEIHDDFSFQHADGSHTYFQVKTRHIDAGAFPFMDDEIVSALARFVAQAETAEHEIREFILITNIGFGCERAERITAKDFLKKCHHKAFKRSKPSLRMAENIVIKANRFLGREIGTTAAIDTEYVRHVMQKVEARVEPFHLELLTRLVEIGVMQHPAAADISREYTKSLAEKLIGILFNRAAKARYEHIPGQISPGLDFDLETDRALVKACTLTRESLQSIFTDYTRRYPRLADQEAIYQIEISEDGEVLEEDETLHQKMMPMRSKIADGQNPICRVHIIPSTADGAGDDHFEEADRKYHLEVREKKISFGLKILLVEGVTRQMLPNNGSLELCRATRHLVKFMSSEENLATETPDRPFLMDIAGNASDTPISAMLAVSEETVLAVEERQADLQTFVSGELVEARVNVYEVINNPYDFLYVSDLPLPLRSRSVLPHLISSIVTDTHTSRYAKFDIDWPALDFAGCYIRFRKPFRPGDMPQQVENPVDIFPFD